MNIFKKKQNRFQKSAEATSAIETLVKANLLKVNPNTYEVKVSRELCWDGKTKKWQANFLSNIHLYIGLRRALKKQDHKDLPIKLMDLNGELLIEKKIDA